MRCVILSNSWTKKTISIYEYLEQHTDDDEVRLIKGTERNRLVDVLTNKDKEVGGGSASLHSFF